MALPVGGSGRLFDDAMGLSPAFPWWARGTHYSLVSTVLSALEGLVAEEPNACMATAAATSARTSTAGGSAARGVGVVAGGGWGVEGAAGGGGGVGEHSADTRDYWFLCHLSQQRHPAVGTTASGAGGGHTTPQRNRFDSVIEGFVSAAHLSALFAYHPTPMAELRRAECNALFADGSGERWAPAFAGDTSMPSNLTAVHSLHHSSGHGSLLLPPPPPEVAITDRNAPALLNLLRLVSGVLDLMAFPSAHSVFTSERFPFLTAFLFCDVPDGAGGYSVYAPNACAANQHQHRPLTPDGRPQSFLLGIVRLLSMLEAFIATPAVSKPIAERGRDDCGPTSCSADNQRPNSSSTNGYDSSYTSFGGSASFGFGLLGGRSRAALLTPLLAAETKMRLSLSAAVPQAHFVRALVAGCASLLSGRLLTTPPRPATDVSELYFAHPSVAAVINNFSSASAAAPLHLHLQHPIRSPIHLPCVTCCAASRTARAALVRFRDHVCLQLMALLPECCDEHYLAVGDDVPLPTSAAAAEGASGGLQQQQWGEGSPFSPLSMGGGGTHSQLSYGRIAGASSTASPSSPAADPSTASVGGSSSHRGMGGHGGNVRGAATEAEALAADKAVGVALVDHFQRSSLRQVVLEGLALAAARSVLPLPVWGGAWAAAQTSAPEDGDGETDEDEDETDINNSSAAAKETKRKQSGNKSLRILDRRGDRGVSEAMLKRYRLRCDVTRDLSSAQIKAFAAAGRLATFTSVSSEGEERSNDALYPLSSSPPLDGGNESFLGTPAGGLSVGGEASSWSRQSTSASLGAGGPFGGGGIFGNGGLLFRNEKASENNSVDAEAAPPPPRTHASTFYDRYGSAIADVIPTTASKVFLPPIGGSDERKNALTSSQEGEEKISRKSGEATTAATSTSAAVAALFGAEEEKKEDESKTKAATSHIAVRIRSGDPTAAHAREGPIRWMPQPLPNASPQTPTTSAFAAEQPIRRSSPPPPATNKPSLLAALGIRVGKSNDKGDAQKKESNASTAGGEEETEAKQRPSKTPAVPLTVFSAQCCLICQLRAGAADPLAYPPPIPPQSRGLPARRRRSDDLSNDQDEDYTDDEEEEDDEEDVAEAAPSSPSEERALVITCLQEHFCRLHRLPFVPLAAPARAPPAELLHHRLWQVILSFPPLRRLMFTAPHANTLCNQPGISLEAVAEALAAEGEEEEGNAEVEKGKGIGVGASTPGGSADGTTTAEHSYSNEGGEGSGRVSSPSLGTSPAGSGASDDDEGFFRSNFFYGRRIGPASGGGSSPSVDTDNNDGGEGENGEEVLFGLSSSSPLLSPSASRRLARRQQKSKSSGRLPPLLVRSTIEEAAPSARAPTGRRLVSALGAASPQQRMMLRDAVLALRLFYHSQPHAGGGEGRLPALEAEAAAHSALLSGVGGGTLEKEGGEGAFLHATANGDLLSQPFGFGGSAVFNRSGRSEVPPSGISATSPLKAPLVVLAPSAPLSLTSDVASEVDCYPFFSPLFYRPLLQTLLAGEAVARAMLSADPSHADLVAAGLGLASHLRANRTDNPADFLWVSVGGKYICVERDAEAAVDIPFSPRPASALGGFGGGGVGSGGSPLDGANVSEAAGGVGVEGLKSPLALIRQGSALGVPPSALAGGRKKKGVVRFQDAQRRQSPEAVAPNGGKKRGILQPGLFQLSSDDLSLAAAASSPMRRSGGGRGGGAGGFWRRLGFSRGGGGASNSGGDGSGSRRQRGSPTSASSPASRRRSPLSRRGGSSSSFAGSPTSPSGRGAGGAGALFKNLLRAGFSAGRGRQTRGNGDRSGAAESGQGRGSAPLSPSATSATITAARSNNGYNSSDDSLCGSIIARSSASDESRGDAELPNSSARAIVSNRAVDVDRVFRPFSLGTRRRWGRKGTDSRRRGEVYFVGGNDNNETGASDDDDGDEDTSGNRLTATLGSAGGPPPFLLTQRPNAEGANMWGSDDSDWSSDSTPSSSSDSSSSTSSSLGDEAADAEEWFAAAVNRYSSRPTSNVSTPARAPQQHRHTKHNHHAVNNVSGSGHNQQHVSSSFAPSPMLHHPRLLFASGRGLSPARLAKAEYRILRDHNNSNNKKRRWRAVYGGRLWLLRSSPLVYRPQADAFIFSAAVELSRVAVLLRQQTRVLDPFGDCERRRRRGAAAEAARRGLLLDTANSNDVSAATVPALGGSRRGHRGLRRGGSAASLLLFAQRQRAHHATTGGDGRGGGSGPAGLLTSLAARKRRKSAVLGQEQQQHHMHRKGGGLPPSLAPALLSLSAATAGDVSSTSSAANPLAALNDVFKKSLVPDKTLGDATKQTPPSRVADRSRSPSPVSSAGPDEGTNDDDRTFLSVRSNSLRTATATAHRGRRGGGGEMLAGDTARSSATATETEGDAPTPAGDPPLHSSAPRHQKGSSSRSRPSAEQRAYLRGLKAALRDERSRARRAETMRDHSLVVSMFLYPTLYDLDTAISHLWAVAHSPATVIPRGAAPGRAVAVVMEGAARVYDAFAAAVVARAAHSLVGAGSVVARLGAVPPPPPHMRSSVFPFPNTFRSSVHVPDATLPAASPYHALYGPSALLTLPAAALGGPSSGPLLLEASAAELIAEHVAAARRHLMGYAFYSHSSADEDIFKRDSEGVLPKNPYLHAPSSSDTNARRRPPRPTAAAASSSPQRDPLFALFHILYGKAPITSVAQLKGEVDAYRLRVPSLAATARFAGRFPRTRRYDGRDAHPSALGDHSPASPLLATTPLLPPWASAALRRQLTGSTSDAATAASPLPSADDGAVLALPDCSPFFMIPPRNAACSAPPMQESGGGRKGSGKRGRKTSTAASVIQRMATAIDVFGSTPPVASLGIGAATTADADPLGMGGGGANPKKGFAGNIVNTSVDSSGRNANRSFGAISGSTPSRQQQRRQRVSSHDVDGQTVPAGGGVGGGGGILRSLFSKVASAFGVPTAANGGENGRRDGAKGGRLGGTARQSTHRRLLMSTTNSAFAGTHNTSGVGPSNSNNRMNRTANDATRRALRGIVAAHLRQHHSHHRHSHAHHHGTASYPHHHAHLHGPAAYARLHCPNALRSRRRGRGQKEDEGSLSGEGEWEDEEDSADDADAERDEAAFEAAHRLAAAVYLSSRDLRSPHALRRIVTTGHKPLYFKPLSQGAGGGGGGSLGGSDTASSAAPALSAFAAHWASVHSGIAGRPAGSGATASLAWIVHTVRHVCALQASPLLAVAEGGGSAGGGGFGLGLGEIIGGTNLGAPPPSLLVAAAAATASLVRERQRVAKALRLHKCHPLSYPTDPAHGIVATANAMTSTLAVAAGQTPFRAAVAAAMSQQALAATFGCDASSATALATNGQHANNHNKSFAAALGARACSSGGLASCVEAHQDGALVRLGLQSYLLKMAQEFCFKITIALPLLEGGGMGIEMGREGGEAASYSAVPAASGANRYAGLMAATDSIVLLAAQGTAVHLPALWLRWRIVRALDSERPTMPTAADGDPHAASSHRGPHHHPHRYFSFGLPGVAVHFEERSALDTALSSFRGVTSSAGVLSSYALVQEDAKRMAVDELVSCAMAIDFKIVSNATSAAHERQRAERSRLRRAANAAATNASNNKEGGKGVLFSTSAAAGAAAAQQPSDADASCYDASSCSSEEEDFDDEAEGVRSRAAAFLASTAAFEMVFASQKALKSTTTGLLRPWSAPRAWEAAFRSFSAAPTVVPLVARARVAGLLHHIAIPTSPSAAILSAVSASSAGRSAAEISSTYEMLCKRHLWAHRPPNATHCGDAAAALAGGLEAALIGPAPQELLAAMGVILSLGGTSSASTSSSPLGHPSGVSISGVYAANTRQGFPSAPRTHFREPPPRHLTVLGPLLADPNFSPLAAMVRRFEATASSPSPAPRDAAGAQMGRTSGAQGGSNSINAAAAAGGGQHTPYAVFTSVMDAAEVIDAIHMEISHRIALLHHLAAVEAQRDAVSFAAQACGVGQPMPLCGDGRVGVEGMGAFGTEPSEISHSAASSPLFAGGANSSVRSRRASQRGSTRSHARIASDDATTTSQPTTAAPPTTDGDGSGVYAPHPRDGDSLPQCAEPSVAGIYALHGAIGASPLGGGGARPNQGGCDPLAALTDGFFYPLSFVAVSRYIAHLLGHFQEVADTALDRCLGRAVAAAASGGHHGHCHSHSHEDRGHSHASAEKASHVKKKKSKRHRRGGSSSSSSSSASTDASSSDSDADYNTLLPSAAGGKGKGGGDCGGDTLWGAGCAAYGSSPSYPNEAATRDVFASANSGGHHHRCETARPTGGLFGLFNSDARDGVPNPLVAAAIRRERRREAQSAQPFRLPRAPSAFAPRIQKGKSTDRRRRSNKTISLCSEGSHEDTSLTFDAVSAEALDTVASSLLAAVASLENRRALQMEMVGKHISTGADEGSSAPPHVAMVIESMASDALVIKQILVQTMQHAVTAAWPRPLRETSGAFGPAASVALSIPRAQRLVLITITPLLPTIVRLLRLVDLCAATGTTAAAHEGDAGACAGLRAFAQQQQQQQRQRQQASSRSRNGQHSSTFGSGRNEGEEGGIHPSDELHAQISVLHRQRLIYDALSEGNVGRAFRALWLLLSWADVIDYAGGLSARSASSISEGNTAPDATAGGNGDLAKLLQQLAAHAPPILHLVPADLSAALTDARTLFTAYVQSPKGQTFVAQAPAALGGVGGNISGGGRGSSPSRRRSKSANAANSSSGAHHETQSSSGNKSALSRLASAAGISASGSSATFGTASASSTNNTRSRSSNATSTFAGTVTKFIFVRRKRTSFESWESKAVEKRLVGAICRRIPLLRDGASPTSLDPNRALTMFIRIVKERSSNEVGGGDTSSRGGDEAYDCSLPTPIVIEGDLMAALCAVTGCEKVLLKAMAELETIRASAGAATTVTSHLQYAHAPIRSGGGQGMDLSPEFGPLIAALRTRCLDLFLRATSAAVPPMFIASAVSGGGGGRGKGLFGLGSSSKKAGGGIGISGLFSSSSVTASEAEDVRFRLAARCGAPSADQTASVRTAMLELVAKAATEGPGAASVAVESALLLAKFFPSVASDVDVVGLLLHGLNTAQIRSTGRGGGGGPASSGVGACLPFAASAAGGGHSVRGVGGHRFGGGNGSGGANNMMRFIHTAAAATDIRTSMHALRRGLFGRGGGDGSGNGSGGSRSAHTVGADAMAAAEGRGHLQAYAAFANEWLAIARRACPQLFMEALLAFLVDHQGGGVGGAPLNFSGATAAAAGAASSSLGGFFGDRGGGGEQPAGASLALSAAIAFTTGGGGVGGGDEVRGNGPYCSLLAGLGGRPLDALAAAGGDGVNFSSALFSRGEGNATSATIAAQLTTLFFEGRGLGLSPSRGSLTSLSLCPLALDSMRRASLLRIAVDEIGRSVTEQIQMLVAHGDAGALAAASELGGVGPAPASPLLMMRRAAAGGGLWPAGRRTTHSQHHRRAFPTAAAMGSRGVAEAMERHIKCLHFAASALIACGGGGAAGAIFAALPSSATSNLRTDDSSAPLSLGAAAATHTSAAPLRPSLLLLHRNAVSLSGFEERLVKDLIAGPIRVFTAYAVRGGCECWRWLLSQRPALAPIVAAHIVSAVQWTAEHRIGLFDAASPDALRYVETEVATWDMSLVASTTITASALSSRGGASSSSAPPHHAAVNLGGGGYANATNDLQGETLSVADQLAMERRQREADAARHFSQLYATDYASNSPHKLLANFIAAHLVRPDAPAAGDGAVLRAMAELVRTITASATALSLKDASFSEFMATVLLCLQIIQNLHRAAHADASSSVTSSSFSSAVGLSPPLSLPSIAELRLGLYKCLLRWLSRPLANGFVHSDARAAAADGAVLAALSESLAVERTQLRHCRAMGFADLSPDSFCPSDRLRWEQQRRAEEAMLMGAEDDGDDDDEFGDADDDGAVFDYEYGGGGGAHFSPDAAAVGGFFSVGSDAAEGATGDGAPSSGVPFAVHDYALRAFALPQQRPRPEEERESSAAEEKKNRKHRTASSPAVFGLPRPKSEAKKRSSSSTAAPHTAVVPYYPPTTLPEPDGKGGLVSGEDVYRRREAARARESKTRNSSSHNKRDKKRDKQRRSSSRAHHGGDKDSNRRRRFPDNEGGSAAAAAQRRIEHTYDLLGLLSALLRHEHERLAAWALPTLPTGSIPIVFPLHNRTEVLARDGGGSGWWGAGSVGGPAYSSIKGTPPPDTDVAAELRMFLSNVTAIQWEAYAVAGAVALPEAVVSIYDRFGSSVPAAAEAARATVRRMPHLFRHIPSAVNLFVTPQTLLTMGAQQLSLWAPCGIVEALRFLSPPFANACGGVVAGYGLRSLEAACGALGRDGPSALGFYMPQLVQCLRCDSGEEQGEEGEAMGRLAQFLRSVCRRDEAFAHQLLWALRGEGDDNSRSDKPSNRPTATARGRGSFFGSTSPTTDAAAAGMKLPPSSVPTFADRCAALAMAVVADFSEEALASYTNQFEYVGALVDVSRQLAEEKGPQDKASRQARLSETISGSGRGGGVGSYELFHRPLFMPTEDASNPYLAQLASAHSTRSANSNAFGGLGAAAHHPPHSEQCIPGGGEWDEVMARNTPIYLPTDPTMRIVAISPSSNAAIVVGQSSADVSSATAVTKCPILIQFLCVPRDRRSTATKLRRPMDDADAEADLSSGGTAAPHRSSSSTDWDHRSPSEATDSSREGEEGNYRHHHHEEGGYDGGEGHHSQYHAAPVPRRVIFRAGDDVRQDQLATQLISVLRRAFEAARVPFFLFPYRVVPTAPGCGVLEAPPLGAQSRNALGAVVDAGLVGWFTRQYGDPQSPAFRTARQCFIESAASYAVASFLLNAKDRHNDNILLDPAGHLIHVGFGGFLLDGASDGGDLSVEAAPFKLTEEMLRLMGDCTTAEGKQRRKQQRLRAAASSSAATNGNGPTLNAAAQFGAAEPSAGDFECPEAYEHFVATTVRCFLAARRYARQLCILVELMLDSGLPCLRPARTVADLAARLGVGLGDHEAAAFMRDRIKESRNNMRTTLYDRYHNMRGGIEM